MHCVRSTRTKSWAVKIVKEVIELPTVVMFIAASFTNCQYIFQGSQYPIVIWKESWQCRPPILNKTSVEESWQVLHMQKALQTNQMVSCKNLQHVLHIVCAHLFRWQKLTDVCAILDDRNWLMSVQYSVADWITNVITIAWGQYVAHLFSCRCLEMRLGHIQSANPHQTVFQFTYINSFLENFCYFPMTFGKCHIQGSPLMHGEKERFSLRAVRKR